MKKRWIQIFEFPFEGSAICWQSWYTFWRLEMCTILAHLACHSSVSNIYRGSCDTPLEPARRAEENAVNRMRLALSKPEISGFQFCIRYTLKAVHWHNANLANDSGQMQQAGVILSISFCRGVQDEKTLNTYFWISFRGRSYTSAKLVYFSKFRNLGDFCPNLPCHSSVNNTAG